MSAHKNVSNQSELQQYITFILDKEKYALDVMEVESIERLSSITRVPKSENFVLGVINLRGDIIPIINTREKMKLSPKSDDDQTRIVVVRAQDYRVGMIVDNVSEVLNISKDNIQDRKEILEERKDEWIAGIIRMESEVVLILDPKKLLDVDDKLDISD